MRVCLILKLQVMKLIFLKFKIKKKKLSIIINNYLVIRINISDNQESKELLPCPFCGHKPKDDGDYFIRCSDALCTLSEWDISREDWNTRAQSKQLTATQQALDIAVEALKSLDLFLTPEIFEIARNAYRCKIIDRNYSHLEALEVCLITVFNELNKKSEAALASIKE